MIKNVWKIIFVGICIFILGSIIYSKEDKEIIKLSEKNVVENIVDKPLFIKDLTTGVLYDFVKLPKPTFNKNQHIAIDYQYFGEIRKVSIELNKKNQIYKVSIPVGYSEKLQSFLEEKISEDNGKKIRFLCKESETDLGILGSKGSILLNKKCIIKYKTQSLELSTSKPIRGAALSYIDLYSMHLELADETLIIDDIELERLERKRASEEAEKKAKSDL